jgi:hypothetical protein
MVYYIKCYVRFRLKLRVVDGTGEAVFVVFDRDLNLLVGENCQNLVTLSEVSPPIRLLCWLLIF